MSALQTWFSKYKVLLSGIVGAIIMAIINLDASNGLEWSALIMPVLIAVTGVIANALRGQWQTIFGILISVVIGWINARINHTVYVFDIQQLQYVLLQLASLFGFTSMGPFKPRTYEHDDTIVKAKENPTTVNNNV